MLPFTTFTRRCSWENHRTNWELFQRAMFDYRRAWKLDGWMILFGFESNIQTSSWYLEHIWIFWTIGIYWGSLCTVLDALDIWMSELFKIQPSWQEWRHLHHGGKIPTCLASWWEGFCRTVHLDPWISLTWGHYLHAVPKDQGAISSGLHFLMVAAIYVTFGDF